MASGKQINELNSAASVGASDVLPIAQSGGREAVKASVTQLAATVADITESGALSELVYATSQGKNLLAQNLTNKGVATDSSETIIQMADKVNNLIIEDNAEYRIGCIAKSMTNTSSTSGDSYLSNARIDVLNENLVFCYYSSNIYILPRVSTATNFTQWLASPLASMSYTKTLTRWAHSHSGKKVALYCATDMTCTVLTLNPTTGEITDTTVYQLTANPYPSSYAGNDCFMDDGVTWLTKDTNSSYYIHVYDVSAATTTQAMSFSVGSYAANGKMYTIGNKIIYSRPQSSDWTKVYIIPLDYNAGTYTRGAFIESAWSTGIFDTSNTYAAPITIHAGLKKGFIFCSTKRTNSGNAANNNECVKYGMICFDVDTGEYFYTTDLPIHSAADMNMLWYNDAGTTVTYNFNGSTTNNAKVPLGFSYFYMEAIDNDSKIRIYNTMFPEGLDCDIVNKTFTIQKLNGNDIYQPTTMVVSSAQGDTTTGLFPVLWRNTDNGYLYGIVAMPVYIESNGSYLLSHTNGYFGDGKPYLIYSTRTVDGKVYPLMGSLNPSYSGALIPYDTTITPAVPDEE